MNLLLVCAANSARSLIAEALFAHLGRGRVKAHSGGIRPVGRPHPLTVELLERHGLAAHGLRSKGWDEFTGPRAPRMDAVITLCDETAAAAPAWPGDPVAAHWRVPDPVAAEGDHADKLAAFEEVYRRLKEAVETVLAQPVEDMPAERLKALLIQAAPK